MHSAFKEKRTWADKSQPPALRSPCSATREQPLAEGVVQTSDLMQRSAQHRVCMCTCVPMFVSVCACMGSILPSLSCHCPHNFHLGGHGTWIEYQEGTRHWKSTFASCVRLSSGKVTL